MKILLTCGLGDFIAIEPFLTNNEKNSVEEIYWATRARQWIIDACDLNYIFPNLKKQYVLYENWGTMDEYKKGIKPYCVRNKLELEQLCSKKFDDIIDYSVPNIMQEVFNKKRLYIKSKIALYKDKLEIKLPKKYFVIHPFSDNDPNPEREIIKIEELKISKFLKNNNIKGIIINKTLRATNINIENTIDLTNKTTLRQSMEIVRRASGFIGAASCFSVLASKLFSKEKLFIKGNLYHLIKPQTKEFLTYYAPYTINSFIYKKLFTDL